ncbi:hypothetical protein SLEP1_g58297, partial [Rubroshorea leprosula]
MLKGNIVKCIPLGQSVVGRLSQDIVAASSNLSVRFWLKSCPKNCSNGSYKCGNLLLHMPTHISMPQKLKCYYFAVEEINCFQVKRKLKDYAMDSQIVRFVSLVKATILSSCYVSLKLAMAGHGRGNKGQQGKLTEMQCDHNPADTLEGSLEVETVDGRDDNRFHEAGTANQVVRGG